MAFYYTRNESYVGEKESNGVFDVLRTPKLSSTTPPVLTHIDSSGLLPGGTSQNGVGSYSYTTGVIPVMPIALKRYIVVVTGFRDSGGSITNLRTPLINTVVLNNTVGLIKDSEGQSDFNTSAIFSNFYNFAGGTITVDVTMNYTINGGTGYVYMFVFDNVQGTQTPQVTTNSSTSAASTTFSSLTVPSNNNPGLSFRLVAGNSSNSINTITFNNTDGFTYTNLFNHDNGTTEWSMADYYLATQNNTIENQITGNISSSTSTAPNGIGWAAAHYRFLS